MSGFDAVLFDAVGTLIEPAQPVAEVYTQAGRRHGSRLDARNVLARFRVAFQRQEAVDAGTLAHRTSHQRERQRWQAIVAEVFADVADTAALFDELWQHFARGSSWRLYDDAVAALAALAQRGIAVGLASNFDNRLPPIWQSLAPAGLRGAPVFVSSEIGYRKPHRDFFAAIQRQLQLPPHRLLLVGDDPTNDHAAALAAGWQALRIDRSAQPRPFSVFQVC